MKILENVFAFIFISSTFVCVIGVAVLVVITVYDEIKERFF